MLQSKYTSNAIFTLSFTILQMVKFLPSIQSLVSSSVGSQPDTLTSRAAEDLLTNENCSPGLSRDSFSD